MADGSGPTPGQVVMPEGLEFVNWMSADDSVALGQVHGRMVTLVGVLGAGSVVDGGFPLFYSPAFSPPVYNTDTAYLVGGAAEVADGNAFTIVFGRPVRDLILHLHSLGSTLTFPGGTPLQWLSGDESFEVSGSTISGGGSGSPDADGSAQVLGTVSTLVFSARNNSSGGSIVDGIYLQVGAWLPSG
jgi:hypothetical protein